MSIWYCGARDCPTHSRPEHRCEGGVWYCRRTQPECPGHDNPADRCASGNAWRCGEQDCPTHQRWEDPPCPPGVWYCGRAYPPCPGHSSRDHRCEPGASLLLYRPPYSWALQQQVGSVFHGTLIDQIDFHLEGLHISPQMLRSVGEVIARGRIQVKVGSTGGMLEAAYSPHQNRMTLRTDQVPDSPEGRAQILHEGVHALVDLFRCTATTELSDEAAAYLAETIYRHHAHLALPADPIFHTADQIARAHGLYQSRGVALSWQQYEPLRRVIHANPAYSGLGWMQRTSGHGVP